MEIRKLINWMRSPWVWRMFLEVPYEGGYVFGQYYPDNSSQAAERLIRYAIVYAKEEKPTGIIVDMKDEPPRVYNLETEDMDGDEPLSPTNTRILKLLTKDMKNPNFITAYYENYDTLYLSRYDLYKDVK